MLRTIPNILNDIGARLQMKIIEQAKVYPSLKDSRFVKYPNEITWDVEDYGGGEYELVMNLPNYAVWIDQGRSPNRTMPPSKDATGRYPIREWMKKKGIDESLEFVIRRKIGIRGIKPRPFLDKALNSYLPAINRALVTGQESLSIHDLEKILKKIK